MNIAGGIATAEAATADNSHNDQISDVSMGIHSAVVDVGGVETLLDETEGRAADPDMSAEAQANDMLNNVILKLGCPRLASSMDKLEGYITKYMVRYSYHSYHTSELPPIQLDEPEMAQGDLEQRINMFRFCNWERDCLLYLHRSYNRIDKHILHHLVVAHKLLRGASALAPQVSQEKAKTAIADYRERATRYENFVRSRLRSITKTPEELCALYCPEEAAAYGLGR